MEAASAELANAGLTQKVTSPKALSRTKTLADGTRLVRRANGVSLLGMTPRAKGECGARGWVRETFAEHCIPLHETQRIVLCWVDAASPLPQTLTRSMLPTMIHTGSGG